MRKTDRDALTRSVRGIAISAGILVLIIGWVWYEVTHQPPKPKTPEEAERDARVARAETIMAKVRAAPSASTVSDFAQVLGEPTCSYYVGGSYRHPQAEFAQAVDIRVVLDACTKDVSVPVPDKPVACRTVPAYWRCPIRERLTFALEMEGARR